MKLNPWFLVTFLLVVLCFGAIWCRADHQKAENKKYVLSYMIFVSGNEEDKEDIKELSYIIGRMLPEWKIIHEVCLMLPEAPEPMCIRQEQKEDA